MMNPRFRDGAACVAKAGLSLDVWAYHTQLGEVADLASRLPDLVLVLDHAGGPVGVGRHEGRREEVLAEWESGMRRLAGLPNVRVKLGGLAMGISGLRFAEAPLPPSSMDLADAWRPFVENCIAWFGPGRCMFESNFPVDKSMAAYGAVWNAFKRLAAGCSDQEKTALFSGTAREVYRLPPVSRVAQHG
jgi:predicted TIM-barrel fold metal-dependent hydrolase